MAKEKSDDPSVFDVERIREFIEMMKEHELNEVDLRQSDKRIKLRRGGEPMTMYAPQMAAAPAAAAAPAGGGAEAAAEEDDSNFEYILSPTVGTFYSKPKPESPDFVKAGDEVGADSVVCIVEAMKMFNEIPAGISGKIVACLVKNEQPVGVNDKLFKVAPN
ncbi:MAG: acetyl-CoA carboxylase biotin carboxyl carrier protein [Planctomycetota bacterium]